MSNIIYRKSKKKAKKIKEKSNIGRFWSAKVIKDITMYKIYIYKSHIFQNVRNTDRKDAKDYT